MAHSQINSFVETKTVCDIELNVRTQCPDKIAEADDVLTTTRFDRRRSDKGVSNEARDKLLVNSAP
jgi:hypothetical protein